MRILQKYKRIINGSNKNSENFLKSYLPASYYTVYFQKIMYRETEFCVSEMCRKKQVLKN